MKTKMIILVSIWAIMGGIGVAAKIEPVENLIILSGANYYEFPEIPKDEWEIIFCSSQEETKEDGRCENAIDGDSKTIWHTRYSSDRPTHPHEIQIDLKRRYSILTFKYLPRQDTGYNGSIANFTLYVTNDKSNWGRPYSEAFGKSKGRWKTDFIILVTGRYIRIIARSEVNGGPLASAAEFYFYGYCLQFLKAVQLHSHRGTPG